MIQCLFFLFMLSVFLLEGLGLVHGRTSALYVIYMMPLVLLAVIMSINRSLEIPKKPLLLLGGFLFFSLVSVFFSVNMEQSAYQMLYYLSACLIWFVVYNHTHEISTWLSPFTIALAMFFLGYTIIINHLFPQALNALMPQRGYQYVSAFYWTHHPLANLLLLPMVLSLTLFAFSGAKKYLIFFLLFLPYFLYSFSRSSYAALTTALLFLMFLGWKKVLKINSSFKYISTLVIVLCGILFFAVVTYSQPIPLISTIREQLNQTVHLPYKTFLSGRNHYFRFAFQSIRDHPLTGIGPANFRYATIAYADSSIWHSDTADNIFLELFAEHGIPAGIFFLLFVLLILSSGKAIFASKNHQKHMWYVVFLTILTLFMFDSAQRYYSYFLYCMVVSAIIYPKEKHTVKRAGRVLILVALVIAIITQCALLSMLLIRTHHWEIGQRLFPFNRNLYPMLIKKARETGNYRDVVDYLSTYGTLFPGDPWVLEYIGDQYKNNQDIPTAISYYERAVKLNKSPDPTLIQKLHDAQETFQTP